MTGVSAPGDGGYASAAATGEARVRRTNAASTAPHVRAALTVRAVARIRRRTDPSDPLVPGGGCPGGAVRADRARDALERAMDEQAAHEALEEVAAPGAGNDGRSWAHQHVMRDVMIVPISAPRSSPGDTASPLPARARSTGDRPSSRAARPCNSVQPAAADREESCSAGHRPCRACVASERGLADAEPPGR